MYNDNGIWKWKFTPSVNKSTGYEGIIDALNIVSKQDFNASTRDQQNAYVLKVLAKIREINVYPIYYYTDEGIKQEIRECMYCSPTFTGDTLSVTTKAGATLLDYMFPNLHLAEAGCATNNNLYSRFYDDIKLDKCLSYYMKYYKFTNVRTMFFMYGRLFWNTATNFSVGRAKAIYNRFLPNGGTVYDFSCGYGARMLAALTDMRASYRYIGCEPNSNTFYNLQRLGGYIEETRGTTGTYELHQTGSEVLKLPNNSVDFAFSCPPYFALERYTTEATQSYNKYTDYAAWLVHYTKPTLENIYDALKPGGTLGFVIGDITYRQKPLPLRSDWCKVATSVGFTFVQEFPIATKARKQEGADTLYIFRKDAK